MKHSKHAPVVLWLALLAALAALGSASTQERARAQTNGGDDLRARRGLPTAQGNTKIAPDLLALARDRRKQQARTRVIVQLDEQARTTMDGQLNAYGARLAHKLDRLNTRVLELPAQAVEALAARADVRFVSPDRETITFGHVSLTTGADAVRNLGGSNNTSLDGTGIGIAVLDSGIDTEHRSFLDRDGDVRVVYSKDFTGERRTDDPYGHGTHVASIAAGNGRIAHAEYIGIAPGAHLVNLRVLNSQGAGTTAGLLAALDWVLANRTSYNIRVVNLSLGAPAVDSYRNDPLCRAVRRLVDAGLVVVAAAGNNGKNGAGQKIYGQIHAPGDEPSAITVGATNTYGTDARTDDDVASYSSRGPTRGSWLDALGVRHYDSLLKPDIVAPGNKLVYAEAEDNLIVTTHPELDAGVSSDDTRKMMFMNGTSMATPVAAGAAALLLQANPSLTPNMVKMILMYTAQPLTAANTFEQGAGQLNLDGAVKLARLVRTNLNANTNVGSSLLTTNTPPEPRTTIAGPHLHLVARVDP